MILTTIIIIINLLYLLSSGDVIFSFNYLYIIAPIDLVIELYFLYLTIVWIAERIFEEKCKSRGKIRRG